MPAAKPMHPRALPPSASPTKEYPRFFQPHEADAGTERDHGWETVDGDDPDVFLFPSGDPPTVNRVEESGIYDVAPASRRPRSASPQRSLLPPSEPHGRLVTTPSDCPIGVGQAPPSLFASVEPTRPRSRAPHVVAVAAGIVFAAVAAFAGVHVARGKRVAFEHGVLTLKAPPSVARRVRGAPPATAVAAAFASAAPALEPPAPRVVQAVPSVSSSGSAEAPGARAKAALAAGDLAKASLLYAAMTESAAGRLEGAVGLAEVARARGDYRGAAARYEEILVNYPAYLPARLGLADATWDGGDVAGARAQYVALLRTYAPRMLPPRVVERSHP